MAATAALNAIPLDEMAMPPEHVVVGVDLGMTCTGVAVWSPGRTKGGLPVVIQQWPGTHGSLYNKVPTTLIYQAGQSRVCSWGFARPEWDFGYGMGVVESFKFFLDKDVLERAFRDRQLRYRQPDIEDVRNWFRDFLHGLHDHVVGHLESEFQVDWLSTKVDYIFGVPTLWRERNALIDDFQNIVAEAGFEKSLNCDVTFRLTEAEAAAVHTAKSLNHKYKVRAPHEHDRVVRLRVESQQGDIILVCDAGGGTTDVCILEVLRTTGEIVELRALSEPNALNAGSTQIDYAFEAYTEGLLKIAHPQVPKHVARDMARGPFQGIKLAFGTREAVPVESIPIPGLEHNIEIPSDILRTMFDEQIGKIVGHIDKEIELLGARLPQSKILYLVLAGGLGSSECLRTEMKKFCRPKGITVLYPDSPGEPPLAVCKGLVIDWMQRFKHGTSILPTRLSGTSYGILCSDRYEKAKHAGQDRVKNRLDNREYAVNQIAWFIRKGDTMQKDMPIVRNFFRLQSSDCPAKKEWRAFIVRSQMAREKLPTFLDQDNPDPSKVQVICQISSDLTPSPGTAGITTKRKYVYFGKKYLPIDYELSIFIGQEYLRFGARMLLSGEESAANMSPQLLKVRWITSTTVWDDDEQPAVPMDESHEGELLNEIFMNLRES